MKPLLIMLLIYLSGATWAEFECALTCSNPVFPKYCQVSCDSQCSKTECDEQGCTCESFTPIKINDCTPPLEPNTQCDLTQSGINCLTEERKACRCNLACTQSCTWSCEIPQWLQQPNCELQCQEPSCLFEETQGTPKNINFKIRGDGHIKN